MNYTGHLCVPLLWLGITGTIFGQIPTPDDAPKPLSPDESVRQFKFAAPGL